MPRPLYTDEEASGIHRKEGSLGRAVGHDALEKRKKCIAPAKKFKICLLCVLHKYVMLGNVCFWVCEVKGHINV
jgi:hypothetical protein